MSNKPSQKNVRINSKNTPIFRNIFIESSISDVIGEFLFLLTIYFIQTNMNS